MERMGGIEDLISHSRENPADLVIVALPVAAEARFADVVKRLSVLPADIKVPAKATLIRFSPRTYSHVGSVAMIDLHDKPITDWGRVSKLVFDTRDLRRGARPPGAGDAGDRRRHQARLAAGPCSSARSATASTTS